MIITNIACKIMNVSQYSNWVFIFIETNEGLTGYGESTLDGYELKIVEWINEVKEKYMGKEPKDCHEMFIPKNVVQAAALSGIDIALWDLKGKFADKPISALFGDKRRESLRMYATFNRALKERTLDESAFVTENLVARGFTGLKCAPFDGYNYKSARSDSFKFLERGVKRFAMMRMVAGEEVEIRVDNHWRFDYDGAMEVAKMISDYNPYWFEAPVSEKDGAEIAKIRKQVGLQIAGAEMQYSITQLKTLFENDALDIYMFDIKYIGGISGLVKANCYASKLKRLLTPHNMSGPVSTAASMHVSAVVENFDSLEYHIEENQWVNNLSNIPQKLNNGEMKVPQGAGLGIELDLELIEANPYKKTIAFRPNMIGDYN